MFISESIVDEDPWENRISGDLRKVLTQGSGYARFLYLNLSTLPSNQCHVRHNF